MFPKKVFLNNYFYYLEYDFIGKKNSYKTKLEKLVINNLNTQYLIQLNKRIFLKKPIAKNR